MADYPLPDRPFNPKSGQEPPDQIGTQWGDGAHPGTLEPGAIARLYKMFPLLPLHPKISLERQMRWIVQPMSSVLFSELGGVDITEPLIDGEVLTLLGGVWTNLPPASPPVEPYGMFYGMTTGTGNGGLNDYAATVAVKAPGFPGRVPFPRDGPAHPRVNRGIPTVGPDAFQIQEEYVSGGNWRVTAKVHTTEPGQLGLERNGFLVDESLATNQNPDAGGHLILIDVVINVPVGTHTLAIINPEGNSTALTITPPAAGGTHANVQSVTVVRVGNTVVPPIP